MGVIKFLQTLCLCHMLTFAATYLAWTRDRTFDNKLSAGGYNVTAESGLHCTRACSKMINCVSFFFSPGQDLNCQLHENVLLSAAGLPSVPGSMYYILDKGLSAAHTTPTTVSVAMTTTVSATTTPPPFSCPPDDSIFRTVQLEDGSTFTYRVVKENGSQSESAASCNSLGGFLARVTTKPKMDMLLELVFNCTGYYGSDYYVDGSNAGATDFYANDAWVMSNGDLVPMTTDFWADGYPNRPDIDHCLRMRLQAAYKWDDCDCNKMFFCVCEM